MEGFISFRSRLSSEPCIGRYNLETVITGALAYLGGCSLTAAHGLCSSLKYCVFNYFFKSLWKYLDASDPPSPSSAHSCLLVPGKKKENPANFPLPLDKAVAGWRPASSG